MSEKKRGRWAESASGYRPGSASARATRPWHVDGEAPAGQDAAPARVAFARTLPVEALEPDPEQPRRHFAPEALEELAASVRAQGILQPLLVRRLPGAGQRFVVVAGERRLRAARMAGLSEVPCMVLGGDSLRDARLAQLAENLQREDLEPMEEARAVLSLAEAEGLTHEELARRLGKSPAYISRISLISRIDSREYEELSTSKPSASLLYEYAQIGDAALRASARALVREGATVRDLEALRGRGKKARAARRGRPASSSAHVEALTRAAAAVERAGEGRGLDGPRRAEALDALARIARWAAGALANDPEAADAARRLDDALTRASSAPASTPAGRAGRGGRRATSSRPR